MMKLKKHILLAALAICMAVVISGCGKKNTNTMDKTTIYREEPIDVEMPEDSYFSVESPQYVNGKIAFSGSSYDEQTGENVTSIYVYSKDGEEEYKIDFSSAQSWIETLRMNSKGEIYAFFYTYEEDYSDPDYPIYSSYYSCNIYDNSGNLKTTVNLENLDMSWISNVWFTDEDNLLLYNYEGICLVDSEFNLIKKTEFENLEFNGVYKTRDGRYTAYCYDYESGQKLYYFDTATLEFGDEISLPANISSYYGIMEGGAYDYYLYSNTGISGFNIGDDTVTEIFNYVNSDVSTSYFNAIFAGDGSDFIGFYTDYDSDNYSTHISRFVKVDPEDVVDKEIITLGCLYISSDIRKNVINFNKTNDKYRITVTDYSSYNTDDDWSAGTTKLNSDIASGNAPDIIVSSDSGTIGNYISKGLFLDLTKYFDNDEEIDKDDIFPNLLSVCSYDGKLYEIVPYFTVQTIIGKTSNLNGITGWNMQEMLDYEASLPEGSKLFSDMTREGFLDTILNVNADEYVDMATAKCSFDSEEFINLLKYLKTLPETIDYDEGYDWSSYDTQWRDNRVILNPMSIYSFDDYKYYLRGYFGEDLTFVGYPAADRNGSVINYYFSLGISSKCADPDAAWEFVRYYLTDEYQDNITYYIPASMSRFDEIAEGATERPYYMDGDEKVYYDDTYYLNGVEIVLDPLTEEEIGEVKAFVLSVKKSSGSINDLEEIILEEAAAYFEGQKTAEEVATIIQSRASIYVNEKQ